MKLTVNFNRNTLNLIGENAEYQIFEDCFQGIPVRFSKHKRTGRIGISAEDAVRCLGYESLNQYLSTDNGRSAIEHFKQIYPARPVFGQVGSGAMFETTDFAITETAS